MSNIKQWAVKAPGVRPGAQVWAKDRKGALAAALRWEFAPVAAKASYSADKEIRAHLRQFWESRGRKVEIVTPISLTPEERAEKRAKKQASIANFLAERTAKREARLEAEAEAWVAAHEAAKVKAAEREAAYIEAIKRSNEERRARLEAKYVEQKAHNDAKREAREAKRLERESYADWRTPEQRREAKAAIRRFIEARRLMKNYRISTIEEAQSLLNTSDSAIVDAAWRKACAASVGAESAPEPTKAPKKRCSKQAYIEAHRRAKKATSQQQLAAKLGLTLVTETQALEIMEKN